MVEETCEMAEMQSATAAAREGAPPQTISYITVPGSWERGERNIPKPQPRQIVYITKGKFLAWGGTAILERLPSGDVIKTPKPHPELHEDHCRNMRLEAEIYQKLGENPRVPRLINWDSDTCCLTLEYMDNGDIGEYIRQRGQNLTDELRLRWAKQAAEGLAALHSLGVIHCDISPRNFLLDLDLNLKISDFGGASLSGSEPSAVAQTRFRHPQFDWDAPPTFGDDIFSLGSLIYFIMTGSCPYADRESDEVEQLYGSQHFPDVTHLTCGSIIYRCWSRNILALEVYSHLKILENRQLHPQGQPSGSLDDEDVEREDSNGTDRNTATQESQDLTFAAPSEPVAYEPPFEVLSQGSTALVSKVRPGVVLKSPRYSWWHSSTGATHDLVKDIKKSFTVEEQILEILGEHPRIVRFLGVSQDPRGLLFAEASGGDLQAYIDQHVGTTDPALRVKWCHQAAEAVHYIHQKGVIHSDLRPESYLLHNESLDLLLCDFGGSTSGDIDGGHLPDSGFFNPRNPWVSTKATDIFSLGSIFYTIVTDHWPYRSPGPFTSVEDKLAYADMVDGLFSLNKFPSTDGLLGGSVIQGCWMERYDDVEEILYNQDLYSRILAPTNIT